LHLRSQGARPETSIDTYYTPGTASPRQITSLNIRLLLRRSCDLLPHLGHNSKDITTRAMHASGAMAALCAAPPLLLGSTPYAPAFLFSTQYLPPLSSPWQYLAAHRRSSGSSCGVVAFSKAP
jgi:hypothetical protein